jgi:hypothetical protein
MLNSESHVELSQTLPLFQQCQQKDYSVFNPIAPCGGSSAVELVVPVCLCKPSSGDLLCLHVKCRRGSEIISTEEKHVPTTL